MSPDCGEGRVGYLSLLAMPSEGTWLCCVHFARKKPGLELSTVAHALIPETDHRWVDLCEVEASLVYISESQNSCQD